MELATIRQLPLNNDVDFLDKKSVAEHGLDQTLKSVSYQPKQPCIVSRNQNDVEMQGVVPFNQTRLNLHLLEKETLVKMSDDPVLAQKWVAEQMKIAAHITTLTTSLQEVLFTDFPAEGDIDGHWTTEANHHLQNILKGVTQCATQEFNREVNNNGSLRNYA
ncbi:hypothetical protein [Shewanella surugensis]|uniref:Uncharacterized protein n=1 Tax=Shewanella surugensis TaxID=212020 RepID=A0ABT0LAH0_9GAMM|nr:hypothetical protein [Shewanella surugensis]MCL1124640.1 hypothetical protein [Shewanella surugensis]